MPEDSAGRAEQMRELAFKWISAECNRRKIPHFYDRPNDITIELLAAFAEAKRERALEEAAKAVCPYCLGKFLHETFKPAQKDARGYWLHEYGHFKETRLCAAGAIHELRREKGRG